MFRHDPGFRARIRAGETLVGTILSVVNGAVAEIMAQSGADWLFVDGEHGAMGVRDIEALLQAAQPYCPCVVRVPAADDVAIKQIVDLGPDGIIVPLVNDAETARRVVDAAKYPPAGARSVGVGRAHAYGPEHGDYLSRANDELSVIVQIEHATGVENAEAIAAVPGVDAIFVGPYDLSGSLGIPGRVDDERVQQRISRVLEVGNAAGVAVGIFGATAEAVRPRIDQGFQLIVSGVDTALLAGAVRDLVAKLR